MTQKILEASLTAEGWGKLLGTVHCNGRGKGIIGEGPLIFMQVTYSYRKFQVAM
jgi:hypothetical protein